MQIKTTRCPTQLLKWSKYRTLTIPNAGKNEEQQKFSLITSGHGKWHVHFGGQFGAFLQN